MATTINTYSVGLTLNAADYINKAALSATESRRLARAIESARDPAEKYTLAQQRLTEALNKGGITQEVYNRLLDAEKIKLEAATGATERLNASVRSAQSIVKATESASARYERQLLDLQRALKHGQISQKQFARGAAHLKSQVVSTVSPMGSLVRHVKAYAAAYVGIHTISKSINLAVQAEQAAASFEILTGSVEGSRAMLSQLKDFAARSPITLSGVQDAAKTMMAFNIPAREVMRNVKMLGDISMGNQQRFDSLTLAFSQMSAAGRLMGQDLLQMVNAGFNPLLVISQQTGEDMTDLRKRMEQGAISAQEVTAAFEAATTGTGDFAGMTDRLANTMGGKMAVAMSNLESAGAQLGQALGPLIIGITDGFNEASSSIQWAITLVEKFADGMGFALAVATDMANALVSWDFDAGWDKSNKFLDALEQRQRDREAAMQKASADALGGADGPMAGMGSAIDDTAKAFEKQMQAMQMQVAELTEAEYIVDRMRWAAEGFTDAQIEQLDKQAEFLRGLKAEEEQLKKNADAAKKIAEELDRDLGSALKAAQDHFEKQRKLESQWRTDASKGPGAGMEIGSAAAAKFMADQVNASIGAAAVPPKPTPGEEAQIKEAQKQFQEMQATRKAIEAQKETLRQMLDELKENGFAGVG